jgi:hypothetical protein
MQEKQVYQIGDEVEISFMGQVKEVYANGDKIYYAIDDGDTFARRVRESQIHPLPQPEDFEKKEGV